MTRCPIFLNWDHFTTQSEYQLFLNVEAFCDKNLLELKISVEGNCIFIAWASIYKGKIPLTRLMGLNFTKEILPPTNLLNSNESWLYEVSRRRNN